MAGFVFDGVDAQFLLGVEQLGWPVDPAHGELDYPAVVAVLRGTDDVLSPCNGGLPDRLSAATG